VRYVPPAQLNPAVRPEVARVIARCLKENPAERYQSAGDLLNDARRLAAAAADSRPRPDDATREEFSESNAEKSRSAKTVPLIAAAAVVVLLGIVGLVTALLILTSTPTTTPEPGAAAKRAVPAGAPRAASANAEERNVELQVSDGRAEVYRDGKLLGTTPYSLKGQVGERVRLTLRRQGYADEPVDFTVSEKKSYTFSMSK
jgi:hypothetical protein